MAIAARENAVHTDPLEAVMVLDYEDCYTEVVVEDEQAAMNSEGQR
jgi:hypothetical protein